MSMTIEITVNRIKDSGAEVISEALKRNCSLTKLLLESDEMSRKRRKKRGRGERLKDVQTDNNIGEAGARMISEALKVNTRLIELNLGIHLQTLQSFHLCQIVIERGGQATSPQQRAPTVAYIPAWNEG